MDWPPLRLGRPRLSSLSGPSGPGGSSLDLWRALSGLEGRLLELWRGLTGPRGPLLHLWRMLGGTRKTLDIGIAALVASCATAVVLALIHVRRRRRRHAQAARAIAEKGGREHVPLTLHPVINPDICIGSLSCLKACPEGDILGVVNGAARLIHADHCIGHGRCAAECPVGAIKLVFGTSERGVDLPMVDQYFESSRPGVHIVGELGGMGLIRNAIAQGVQVSERLAQMIAQRGGPSGPVDVAIVGGGPAGLATALGLKAKGRTFCVLEQGSLGGTIANYPRQKVVMTEPAEIPFYGKLGKNRISKEELLTVWQGALRRAGVRINEGVEVSSIEGNDGAFRVVTKKGTVQARKVVLATGRRGTPRKLGVPGEELSKVAYGLIDPDQYEGCKVLVVGGGDSAIEAAAQLAEESDAEVTISYRGEEFARVREANRTRINQLAAQRRVRTVMSSQVDKILPDEVVLTASGSPQILRNDFVIVNIGGDLPLEFLARSRISLKKHFGEELGKPAGRVVAMARRGLAKEDRETEGRRRAHRFYLATGALILTWLTLKGWDYYLLSRVARLHSPLHATLRPAGAWGHGVGIVATAFMLLNFLYPVRKRTHALSGVGSIRSWLDFHMFVGFMSPLVIAFHAAFQSNNQLATGTAAALLIVVLTGIFGRFIYGLVPSSGGKEVELADLLGRWERLKARLEPLIEESHDPAFLKRIFAAAASPVRRGSLLGLLLRLPFGGLRTRLRLLGARWHFGDHGAYAEFREGYLKLHRIRTQIGFYQALKKLMRTWRIFHASLAGFLVVAIAAHIAVSLYLGYGWRR
jgi:dihydropyrimidine dehydrogenase (NAD+) subunit PreT